jgi:hypothetical protein
LDGGDICAAPDSKIPLRAGFDSVRAKTLTYKTADCERRAYYDHR